MRKLGSNSRRAASPVLFARLGRWARVEAHTNGAVVVVFEGDPVMLGRFGTAATAWLHDLRAGVPLSSLDTEGCHPGKEIDILYYRLAAHGLLEFRLASGAKEDEDLLIIEPQMPGYRPQMASLSDDDVVVLSRFAYLRRRGNDMVLESPRAAALFRICNPNIAKLLAALGAPQQLNELRQRDGFPSIEVLSLLADCDIVLKADPARDSSSRLSEGDQDLALWDFHDLLFHARSTEGRHVNPIGGVCGHGGIIPQLPVTRPSWPGSKIDLCAPLACREEPPPPISKLLRASRSTRDFDDRRPITLAELSCFLDAAARALPRPGNPEPIVRPFPSAGASSELELYLSVHLCEGLAPGFYHYEAGTHALVLIDVAPAAVKASLAQGAAAMGVAAPPQILITIAARFGRISWKYSSIAYALILKDAGVLTEVLHLVASGTGLGGCAIGIANVEQFEKMTGLGFHSEGPVGQFALGRPVAATHHS